MTGKGLVRNDRQVVDDKVKVKVKSLSRVWLFATPWTAVRQALLPWDFPDKILEWVALSFSRESSRPRDQTQVSRIVGRRFYHLSRKSCTFCREGLYFLFYKFICLSLLGLSCDTQDLVAAFGIFNCSLWTLSCGMWDLAVQPGIEPGPLHWEGRVLASNREVPGLYFHIPPGTLLMIVK